MNAIEVTKVKKHFLLPHEKKDSIKRIFTGFFKSKNSSAEVHHALRNVSFKIKEGEFFGIVGRNGSGKSTLLKMLAGIYLPSSGSIKINGKLVPFIELGVGFNPELTGKENVYLNGALLGFSKKEIDARYDKIVEFAELERFMDQRLKNYSSGMQVRLAFSVAIMAEADILLIDEVLAVGDADFQRKCYDFFKSLKKSGKTIVFVTHDMGAVEEYCDRAILIDDGVITCEGTARDVASEYLKLFNKGSDEELDDGKHGKRWGNGQIKVTDMSVDLRDKNIVIDVNLQAGKQAVDDYVFGYRFIDSEGRIIMGGSTLNADNGRSLSIGAKQKQHLQFVMPNVLGSGTVVVGMTIRSMDGATIYDATDNYTSLKIARTESYYPIVAPAKLIVN